MSLVNATVQKGGYFEIWVTQFSPNSTVDGLRKLSCGNKKDDGSLNMLSVFDVFKTPPRIEIESIIPPEYDGRIIVRDLSITRIKNANFADEGREFYCRLTYNNHTTDQRMDVVESVKLEIIYGKQTIQLLRDRIMRLFLEKRTLVKVASG